MKGELLKVPKAAQLLYQTRDEVAARYGLSISQAVWSDMNPPLVEPEGIQAFGSAEIAVKEGDSIKLTRISLVWDGEYKLFTTDGEVLAHELPVVE